MASVTAMGAGTTDRSAFAAATSAFLALTHRVRPDAWEQQGLGVWTVRDLVGHTSRSLVTIEAYLGKPSPGEPLDDPVAYYHAAQAVLADKDAVAQRGRDAGAAMGDDPPSYLNALAQRVLAMVDASPDDVPVGTPLGTMTLGGYLPTRVFELAVHSLDLARALNLDPPQSLGPAVGKACELVGRLAASSPHADEFLLALTGRTALPAGFSVV
jgi:uncharacterized protein (TIGR03083 family)